jgi:hypothetical protein
VSATLVSATLVNVKIFFGACPGALQKKFFVCFLDVGLAFFVLVCTLVLSSIPPTQPISKNETSNILTNRLV